MKQQHDPVSADEQILRRILLEHVDLSLSQPVSMLGFRPTDKDVDGISVFRAAFVSPENVAKAGNRGLDGYYVVSLRVSDVTALGMSVVANPQCGGLPGHSLIPELSTGANKADKKACKELQLKLASSISRDDVVHRPLLK